MRSKQIIVVGGGLAGLACAKELVEHGANVTLLEAQPRLGGKATSWTDDDGDIIESGLHVLTPRYESLLSILADVGAQHNLVWRDPAYTYALRGGRVGRLRLAALPPPLHLLGGILRYEHLTWRERLSGILALTESVFSTPRHRERLDDRTFDEWLRSRGVSRRLTEQLLEPGTRGVTFLGSADVSARVMVSYLHTLWGDRESGRIALIRGGLERGLIRPIADSIRSRGVQILLGVKVDRLELGDGGIEGVVTEGGDYFTADAYVSAVPAHDLVRMLPVRAWDYPYFSSLRCLGPVPVISVQLWFDRKITKVGDVIMSPGCVFCVYADLSNANFPAARSLVQLVVAPAEHLLSVSDQDVVDHVVRDLRDVWGTARRAEIIKYAVVRTPRAFHALRPGREIHRPRQRSPFANFVLAGDFTQSVLPPNMETATSTGIAAARQLLKSPQDDSKEFVNAGIVAAPEMTDRP